jgi:hypothetical protein
MPQKPFRNGQNSIIWVSSVFDSFPVGGHHLVARGHSRTAILNTNGPVNRQAKLTKRTVDAATAREDRYDVWDSQLRGFGVRLSTTGTKTFILRYRPRRAGRSAPKRFMTLGRYGPVTVEEARDRATKLLGAVADGQDPAAAMTQAQRSPTVAEAAIDFLNEHVATKRKPTTAAFYRHILDRHIVPGPGRRKLRDLTKADVARFHNSLRKTSYLANRVVAALGSLYSWAGRRGLVPEEFNPTRRLEKFRESRRERKAAAS